MVFTGHFFGPERYLTSAKTELPLAVNAGAEVRQLFGLLPTPWLQQRRRGVVHD
jgi:hypothetical protein